MAEMSIGAGITAAAAILGTIFGAIAIIWKMIDRNKPVNMCMAHSGVLNSITNIEGWLKGISDDVKELLKAAAK